MVDVLAFVEDPGAANYVVGLAKQLGDHHVSYNLLATGYAVSYLKQRGESFQEIVKTDSADTLLWQQSPQLVLVGTSENPDSLAFALIQEAQNQAIITAGIIDAPNSLAYRFRGRSHDPLAYLPQHVLITESVVGETLRRMGVAPSQIHIIQNPYSEKVIDTRKKLLKEDWREKRKALYGENAEGKKIITFLSELPDGLDPTQFLRSEDYTLKGWGIEDGRTEIVFEELVTALNKIDEDIHLVVRLHPKETVDCYKPYLEYIKQFSISEEPLSVVFFSDLVVGLTTNLLAEAVLMGVPALSIIPRKCERSWLSQLTMDPIPYVTDRKNIAVTITQLLSRNRAKGLPRCPDKKNKTILCAIQYILYKNA